MGPAVRRSEAESMGRKEARRRHESMGMEESRTRHEEDGTRTGDKHVSPELWQYSPLGHLPREWPWFRAARPHTASTAWVLGMG